MAGGVQHHKSDKPSIKYRQNPNDGESFDFVELNREDYAVNSSGHNQQNVIRKEVKSAEILSTSDLISTIGQLWDCAACPLSVSEPKTHLKYDITKGNMFYYSAKVGNITELTTSNHQNFSVDVAPTGHSSPVVETNIECLKVAQKISYIEPCSGSHINSIFWRHMKSDSSTLIKYFREKGQASLGTSYDLKDVYEGMSEITLTRLKPMVKSIDTRKMKEKDCYPIGHKNATCSNLNDVTSPTKITSREKDACLPEVSRTPCSSSVETVLSMHKQASVTSLCTDYLLDAVKEEIGSVTAISRFQADYHANLLALGASDYEESQKNTEENHLLEGKRTGQNEEEFSTENKSKVNIGSSRHDRPCLARKEHAFAGAFAGIFVSLCLHPVDTIKTVTQSCRADQKSIHEISRSIITERGVTGLYRGVASNIASSAPISAIYTFTYESVKGALLPLFMKEYHSLAHCVAGGCASIATSFIFTPSERIKQQMQVSSHYQNCWNALVGIIRKGGFTSLYAGWGAVLCRNVPHSIIKFYTYESLKQLMLSSFQSNGQNDTLRTLVCGGLAGSTAAFFTTPFDVVKTRLQTQIPGPKRQIDGVFNTLAEIAKHEGPKGLYRGLTPRLVMYMTQGALFFASYESFKRLFSLDAMQGSTRTIQYEPNMKENLTSLPRTA